VTNLLAQTNHYLVCEVGSVVFGMIINEKLYKFEEASLLSLVFNPTGLICMYLVKFDFTRVTCFLSIPLLSYSMFLWDWMHL
jgi:hypothetical protein